MEFSNLRIPTVSVDHCFQGTEEDEKHAHSNPCLIMYVKDAEWISAITAQSKAIKPCIVAHTNNVFRVLGCDGIKIAFKSDGAKELEHLRSEVSMARSLPTVPACLPLFPTARLKFPP